MWPALVKEVVAGSYNLPSFPILRMGKDGNFTVTPGAFCKRSLPIKVTAATASADRPGKQGIQGPRLTEGVTLSVGVVLQA